MSPSKSDQLAAAQQAAYESFARRAALDPVKLRRALRVYRVARQLGLVDDEGYPVEQHQAAS